MGKVSFETVLVVCDRQVPLVRRVCEARMLQYRFVRFRDGCIFLYVVYHAGVSQSILEIGKALGKANLG